MTNLYERENVYKMKKNEKISKKDHDQPTNQ